MGYGKHFDTMYTGSMRGSGALTFAVWGYVISHVMPPDFEVELNPEILGFYLGESAEDVAAVIKRFTEPDPRSRTQDHEGRKLLVRGTFLYFVVNGNYYHNLQSTAMRRAYWREQKKKRPIPEETDSAPPAPPTPKFVKPTREEMDFHALSLSLPPEQVDAFVNYYSSNGWKVGKNSMKDWRAAMNGWCARWKKEQNPAQKPKFVPESNQIQEHIHVPTINTTQTIL